MATDTAAFTTLQVIPVIEERRASLDKQPRLTQRDGSRGRQAARRRPGRGVEAAAKRVEAATEKVSKANDKAADSEHKLRTAEAQLQTLRDKGVNDADRLVAAEEKVAKAKRDNENASKDATKAAMDLRTRREGRRRCRRRHRRQDGQTRREVCLHRREHRQGRGDDGHGVRRCRKVLYDIGAQFDDVTDTIRIGTGATGTQLDSWSTLSSRLAPKFQVRSPTSGRVSLI